MYSEYFQRRRGHLLFSEPSEGCEKFSMVLLEAEAAITSCCEGC